MIPVKCNGCNLYYDGDKYETCPHCEAAAEGKKALPKSSFQRTEKRPKVEPTVVQEEAPKQEQKVKKEKKHLFGKRKKEKKPKAEKRSKKSKSESQNSSVEADNARKSETIMRTDINYFLQNDQEQSEPPVKETTSQKPEVTNEPEPNNAGNETLSIADAVKNAESVPGSGNQKTVARYNFSNQIEPVVGWLVCTRGEYKGDSFNIKSGRNNIGRSLTMDIALAKEKSVSRERHSSIVFEPNQKKFFIQSGDSSGLTYVNDDLLMMFQELHDYDVITLGESLFIFMSFAGNDFSWDDYT